MAKASSQFVCQECGAVTPRWAGKCEACGAWNSIIEEAVPEAAPKGVSPKGGRKIAFVGLDGESDKAPRRTTGIAELDRVLGGGVVVEVVPGDRTVLVLGAHGLVVGGEPLVGGD
ncbi:hypothetical protein WDZ92_51860, partial [Nostoc sp. NIES-2111]